MAQYYYFVASLPMLSFGMKPPFSYDVFLKKCRQFLSGRDFGLIASLPEAKDKNPETTRNETVRKWLAFDTALRNELAKVRSSRRRVEPSKYLRGEDFAGPALLHIAMTAHRNTSVLEAERFLDQQRWNALAELESGHYFDEVLLAIYAYKLRMLERWENIRSADKETLLERALNNA